MKPADKAEKPITIADIEPMAGKVRAAFLHQSVTWPGQSGSEKSITASKIPGVVIRLCESGIVLDRPQSDSYCFVPMANIANVVIEKPKK